MPFPSNYWGFVLSVELWVLNTCSLCFLGFEIEIADRTKSIVFIVMPRKDNPSVVKFQCKTSHPNAEPKQKVYKPTFCCELYAEMD